MFGHQLLQRLVYTGLVIAGSMCERLRPIYMTMDWSVDRAAVSMCHFHSSLSFAIRSIDRVRFEPERTGTPFLFFF